jgi:hypothetical protein
MPCVNVKEHGLVAGALSSLDGMIYTLVGMRCAYADTPCKFVEPLVRPTCDHRTLAGTRGP